MVPIAGSNVAEMTVSELSDQVRQLVEGGFRRIRVRGELGRVRIAPSGHFYADLKDDRSVLSVVMWKAQLQGLVFSPREGMEILAEGKLSTYGGRSSYQLIADMLHPAGDGALLLQLEERRRKLAAEGLFDVQRKRSLPAFPRVIGVVSSPSGAVIQDILHRIRSRFPCRVLLWPSRVQGMEAAAEICAAIEGFNLLPEAGIFPRPDVLIVARGGGSVEDLWCFNEESVVRAAAASSIPLISAVGHETDSSLIDHAADVRAPTPSAAAEMAVPERKKLLIELEEKATRQQRAFQHILQQASMRLRVCEARFPDIMSLLQTGRQQLDRLSMRFEQTTLLILERGRNKLELMSRVLDSISPAKILDRGYAIVRDARGNLFSSAASITAGRFLRIRFSDGEIKARVEGDAGKRQTRQPRLL